MTDETTSLKRLTPSRKAVRAGDVYALGIDGRYFLGRVVSTEAQAGLSKNGTILAYLFGPSASTIHEHDQHELDPGRLLIPPFIINRLPWSRGYFETVAHRPITPGDVLEQHCFRSGNGKIFDEFGNELSRATEPCGRRGLSSYRLIEEVVSRRLGLALAEG